MGTPTQDMVDAMTNAALADRLTIMKVSKKAFTEDERRAFLTEAAFRLSHNIVDGPARG